MALATWWQGDPLPELAPLPDFSVGVARDRAALANLAHLTEEEVTRRVRTGSQAYIAYLGRDAVAYGWEATHFGEIVEIGLRFMVPDRQRYLWDFATLPNWRGRGIYPRLLQAIMRQHITNIERFWILYKPDNIISEKGIHKAGFQSILDFSIEAHGFLGHPLNNSPAPTKAPDSSRSPSITPRRFEACPRLPPPSNLPGLMVFGQCVGVDGIVIQIILFFFNTFLYIADKGFHQWPGIFLCIHILDGPDSSQTLLDDFFNTRRQKPPERRNKDNSAIQHSNWAVGIPIFPCNKEQDNYQDQRSQEDNDYIYRRANVFSQIIAQAHQQYDNEYRNQEPETGQAHIDPEVVIQEMRDLDATIDRNTGD
ncbi:GNAT family N-acetyltransferase [Dictyobacter vulcani]|uniref:GNAT family N-acetyltransferase n=1 Tax=Dictyobacter vulcani TaxID=2607529 RepID=UPI00124FC284|nr:hypothetical protein [Dictyobacter vulcani]